MHYDHLYLDQDRIRELADLLREIPDLTTDLTDAMARRARLGGGAARRQPRAADQPLPYNAAAADVARELHAVLVSWVRLVCEHRGLDYDGDPSTAGLAVWLHRNIFALVMTPGVEDAPEEIGALVRVAARIVCPPATVIRLDAARLDAARRQRLNASGIATLARELGEEYRGLNTRRIQTLRDADRIHPVPGPWAPDWPEQFVVGEVLDAHLEHPRRGRSAPRKAARRPTVGIEVKAG
jgi:hypothetical protein